MAVKGLHFICYSLSANPQDYPTPSEIAGDIIIYRTTLCVLASVSFVVVVAFSVVVCYHNKRRSKNLPKPGETMVLLEHSEYRISSVGP